MAAIVASIDSTPGQVFADALLVVAVAVNAYLGWSHGLVRRLFSALGVFLGVFAATNLGNAVAGLVHSHSLEANAWSFVAIFVFVVIVIEVLGALMNDRLQKIVVAAFDRVGGVLVGAVVGVAEVLILFLVAIAVSGAPSPTPSTMAQDIHAATLSGQAVRLEPQVHAVFGPVLPSNLSSHFAQNTPVITPPV
ncbi:MAG TPA: CvpA family protein [Candidatus Acidoferrales bacterium]|nr:CvpA family protein [Candidatus Acidoferrales bacterium]